MQGARAKRGPQADVHHRWVTADTDPRGAPETTMLNLLANLVVLALFALAVRGVLAAQEVTWPRMILAVLGGYVVGGGVAVLLLVDVSGLPDPDAMQAIEERFAAEGFASLLLTVSLPFQVIATMAAVILLELVRPRPPRRRGLRRLRPLHAIRRRIEIAVWPGV
jgi:hypothetical protein